MRAAAHTFVSVYCIKALATISARSLAEFCIISAAPSTTRPSRRGDRVMPALQLAVERYPGLSDGPSLGEGGGGGD